MYLVEKAQKEEKEQKENRDLLEKQVNLDFLVKTVQWGLAEKQVKFQENAVHQE